MNYNYGSDCLEGKTLLYSYYDARIVGVRRTEQSVGIIVGDFWHQRPYYLGSERRRNRMQKYGEIKDLVNAVLESYDKYPVIQNIDCRSRINSESVNDLL